MKGELSAEYRNKVREITVAEMVTAHPRWTVFFSVLYRIAKCLSHGILSAPRKTMVCKGNRKGRNNNGLQS